MEKNKLTPGEVTFSALLTREELAEVLRVTGRTIAKLVASGQFPAPLKIGRQWRWLAKEVNDFLHRKGASA